VDTAGRAHVVWHEVVNIGAGTEDEFGAVYYRRVMAP